MPNGTRYTDAWVIERSRSVKPRGPARLLRRQVPLRALDPREVLVEPVLGCWEANMTHAIERRPIDICRERGEEYAVLGNTGVVRVVEAGDGVHRVSAGDLCMVVCIGTEDAHGFVDRVFAYDCPNTIGLLAKQTIMFERQLIRLSDDSRWSARQWAAFSGRYVTAWANWHLAYGCWRQLWKNGDSPTPQVWGWGGGVTLATLELAQRCGCATAMMSMNDRRLALLEEKGVRAVDRRPFEKLSFDPQRYRRDKTYRAEYIRAEEAFLCTVESLTNGAMVSIFVDYIGLPVWRSTLKALGRPGVITSAGWKRGMITESLRALECMRWHTHVYTHYARYAEATDAVAFAEREAWIPSDDGPVYDWDDVPALADDYASDKLASYFPLYQVNPN